MPEFRFTGRLILSGVTFYLSAPDAEAAKAAATAGGYDEYDADCAEAVDWDIKPDSIQEN